MVRLFFGALPSLNFKLFPTSLAAILERFPSNPGVQMQRTERIGMFLILCDLIKPSKCWGNEKPECKTFHVITVGHREKANAGNVRFQNVIHINSSGFDHHTSNYLNMIRNPDVCCTTGLCKYARYPAHYEYGPKYERRHRIQRWLG